MFARDSEFYVKVLGLFQILKQHSISITIDGDTVTIYKAGRQVRSLPIALFYRLEPVEIIELCQIGDTGGST